MTAGIYELFNRPRPAADPAPQTSAPARAAVDGLHPYAAAAVTAELDRLTALPRPWRPNSYWDQTTFEVACNLIELAHSPWSGYTLPQARTDLYSHAPADEAWGPREHAQKWQSALDQVAGQGRPEPAPGELPPVTTITVPDLDPDLEATFWDARPILRHVHDFARARRTSPWAVLGVTLARIITATPHQACLPPIVGGRGSLNIFIGLVGPSGAGKGAASGAAADAVHIDGIKTARLASGEAIAHLYKRRLTKAERDAGESDWTDNTHARLIDVSEIDRFAAQSNRQGSTLMADLRSAWSGEMLGQIAADPTRSFLLEPHQYRLAMVAGIQPHRAQILLDDEDGGTPQRFVWLPVTDPAAPAERPEPPAPMSWAPPRLGGLVGVGGAPMDVAPVIVAHVDAGRLATLRGEADPLDGHRNQSQLKVAAALGLADNRYSITEDDWELAEVIMTKSDATRSAVVNAMRAKALSESRQRAEADASRAVIVEEHAIDAAVKRVCGVIVKKLGRTPGWVPHGELRRAVTSRDRHHFEDAMRRLYDASRIEHMPGEAGVGNGSYRLTEEAS